MSKLAISNIAWEEKEDEAMYALLKRAGYEGLEIAPTRLFPSQPYDCCGQMKKEAERLKEKYGLSVASLQSIWYGRTEKLFGSDRERELLLEYTCRAIDFAAAAGCGNLVFGSPKNRVRQSGCRESEAEDFFRKAGEYAARKGTCLSIEANPAIYGTDYINRTEEAAQLVRRVGCPGFRVNLDLGTVIANGERLEDLEKEMAWVNHVHISEPQLVKPLRRGLHRELAKMLQTAGYEGYVSIEMGRQAQTGPIEETIWYIKEIFG